MLTRCSFVAVGFLSAIVPPVATAQPAGKVRTELVLEHTYAPTTLVPGELVHLQRIISSRLNAQGTLDHKTQDLFKDLEVVQVDRNPPPGTRGIRVVLNTSEEQAATIAGMTRNAPVIKNAQGNERTFLPLRLVLARERLTGLEGRAAEIVAEGPIKLEPMKSVTLKLGKDVMLALEATLEATLGQLFKEPVVNLDGKATNTKSIPVDVVGVITFADESGQAVAVATTSVRGLYPGATLPLQGALIKGRTADFHAIARYRAHAWIVPSVEPETSAAKDVRLVKLTVPAEAAVLVNLKSRLSSWKFSWEPLPGATAYHLVAQRQGVAEPFVNIQTSSSFYTKNAPFPPRPFTDAELEGWTWKVRPLVNGAWGEWSKERAFTVAPAK